MVGCDGLCLNMYALCGGPLAKRGRNVAKFSMSASLPSGLLEQHCV